MLIRFLYPVLFSLSGLLFFLLPFLPLSRFSENNSKNIYTGANTISCNFNGNKFHETTMKRAELTHDADLFYLNLWIGTGHENRITFVIRGKDIKETTYELDHPSSRYISFLYNGKHCTYSSDDYYTGMLMIHRYDTVNKIIAGSFEFMAYSIDCNEIIRVNNGMFDAHYLSD